MPIVLDDLVIPGAMLFSATKMRSVGLLMPRWKQWKLGRCGVIRATSHYGLSTVINTIYADLPYVDVRTLVDCENNKDVEAGFPVNVRTTAYLRSVWAISDRLMGGRAGAALVRCE